MDEQIQVLFVPTVGNPEIVTVNPILSDLEKLVGGVLEYHSLGDGIIAASARDIYSKNSARVNFYTPISIILGKVVIYSETKDGQLQSLPQKAIDLLTVSLAEDDNVAENGLELA